MNYETAAKKVWAAAGNRFAKAHKNWEGDSKMMKVMAQDYLDLIAVADAIGHNEDLKKASRMISDLDTEVRDDIPDAVYNWVMDNRS